MHPAVIPHVAQDRRQAVRLDRIGIQFGEPCGDVAIGVQPVAEAVVGTEVPVQVPDVVPPADQLPDEPLHRGDRQIVMAIGGLDPAHQLERIQQPEIQRTGHQRMRQPGIAGQHRVLVGSEGRQAVVDEVLKRGQRLAPGGGKPAGGVDPDEADITVRRPAIEVAPDLVVDLVLLRPPRGGHADPGDRWSAAGGLGRRQPVLLVVVPLPADRFVAVHQHIQSASGQPVVVLHEQPAGTPGIGPLGEFGHRGRESASRQQTHSGRALDQVAGGVAGRVTHGQFGAGRPVAQHLRVGRCRAVLAAVTQLGRPMPHRRQHQMCFLPVEPASGEHLSRLDQQHPLVGRIQEMRTELIAEQPADRFTPGLPGRPAAGHSPAGAMTTAVCGGSDSCSLLDLGSGLGGQQQRSGRVRPG